MPIKSAIVGRAARRAVVAGKQKAPLDLSAGKKKKKKKGHRLRHEAAQEEVATP